MVDVVEQAYTDAATPMGWDNATIRFPSISSCMAVCIRPKHATGALVGLHLGLFMGAKLGGDIITPGQVDKYLADFFKLCGSKGFGASAVMLMGMWDIWFNAPASRLALRNGVATYAKAQGLANLAFYDASNHPLINFEITPATATYGTAMNNYTAGAVPFVAQPV